MKTNQHTAEQIIKILEQAEKGEQTIASLCREHGITENTFYRWRKAYGGMSVNEAQRPKFSHDSRYLILVTCLVSRSTNGKFKSRYP
jgi:putative transposase